MAAAGVGGSGRVAYHRTAAERVEPAEEFVIGDTPRPPVATGARRVLYLAAGFGCVALAYVGVFVPGLPTTPWVLLAGYCFARSSPRLERWLKRSPVFGRLLRDWDEHRGVRRWVKVVAVLTVVTAVTLSITLTSLPVWVKWVIGGCAAVGVSVIVFVLPTIQESKKC